MVGSGVAVASADGLPDAASAPRSCRTSLTGIAKPMPVTGRPVSVLSTLAVITPMTLPLASSSAASAVSRIQRRVGLQVVIPLGRDDAPADGRLLPQFFAQGVADGDDPPRRR